MTVQHSLRNKASGTTEKGMERVLAILQAARDIFATEGYAALSMRRVAGQLGISLSNLQHYYRSKDLLVEAVLQSTMNQFQSKIDNIATTMGQAARIDQFTSTVDMFLEELSDPVTYGVFFEIWALAARNEFASALMDKMIAREKKAIYKLISGLAPGLSEQQTMQRAVLIVAQIEGLMLFRFHRKNNRSDMRGVHAAARQAVLNLATQA